MTTRGGSALTSDPTEPGHVARVGTAVLDVQWVALAICKEERAGIEDAVLAVVVRVVALVLGAIATSPRLFPARWPILAPTTIVGFVPLRTVFPSLVALLAFTTLPPMLVPTLLPTVPSDLQPLVFLSARHALALPSAGFQWRLRTIPIGTAVLPLLAMPVRARVMG